MISLTKENVTEYVNRHVPSLSFHDPVEVIQIGDGELGQEVEGDGYCNYIFRLRDGQSSCIVKQTATVLRRRGALKVTPKRSEYEYEIMKMRSKIVPQYVPEVYYGDPENHVIVMEDVSNLKLIRFQLNENHRFPNLARMFAQYLAATHFYTSEFYLPVDDYRKMIAHFMDADMRNLMEDTVFIRIFGADDYDPACGPAFKEYCESIKYDKNLQLQRYRLRHLFMSKSETLIHGDFHTSNIFADDQHLKVIDMEYPISAPLSYDLGFLAANFISQLCSIAFRPFESEEARKEYYAYVMTLFQTGYHYYIQYFFEYWDKDAKLEYRLSDSYRYRDSIAMDILHEFLGFAACANFSRVCGNMDTADFDCIEDNDLRTRAKFLSINIDALLFEKWDQYRSLEEAVEDIIALTKKHRSLQ